jgi:starch-binding outer membrane protein, SusD/RagB family
MKKISIPFFISLLMLASSCQFLDESSPNNIAADEAITDAASAEAAVLGLYSAMQQPGYYGESYLLASEGHTDNGVTGGYQSLSLTQLGDRAVTGANVITGDIWTAIFRVIANSNYLLEGLNQVTDLTPAQKNQLEGQARAIRAMAHFDLLRYFGEHWNNNSAFGIPLIQSVQGITDRPNRATVAATNQFIIDELTKAATQLDASEKDIQFVNLNTVNALLARVYLYRKDLGKAATFASKVIDSGDFALLSADAYAEVFQTRLSAESIFELAFDNQNRSGYNGATYSRDDAIRSELSYLAAKDLQDFFAARPGDVRSSLLNFDPGVNDPTIIPNGRTQKYRGEESRDNPAYVLRLAEMYLIRAEALGRSNGLADLNTLRTQRGLDAISPAELPNDAAYLQAILDERRAEFNFEGHRYFDLARTQQIKAVLGIDEFHGIMPIPNRELTVNTTLKQNPGYVN